MRFFAAPKMTRGVFWSNIYIIAIKYVVDGGYGVVVDSNDVIFYIIIDLTQLFALDLVNWRRNNRFLLE